MKSPKALNELINNHHSNNSLTLYRQKSEFFIKIQAILSGILGDNIAQNVIVSNYKNSNIYFESHNPAVVTALKMQKSVILSKLRSQLDPALGSIDIKVSPKSTQAASKIKHLEKKMDKPSSKKQIPAAAAAIFQSISENCDEQLKVKLNRLMTHKKTD